MTVRQPIVLAAVSAVAVGVGAWGVGPAAAASNGLTLRYNCSLPPFPDQAMTARLTWNAPGSVMVGRATPVIPVDATATMGATVTSGLGLIGAATVQGSVDATGVVVAPDGDTDVALPLTVPRTDVPVSGPITVAATGTTPVLVFHRPGRATITVGSGLAVHLVPRNAAGGSTVIGQVDASCTLDPGQDDVLTSFEITAAPTTPTLTTGRTTAPAKAVGGGATAPTPPTPPMPPTTATSDPSGPATSGTSLAAPGSEVPGTADTGTGATRDPVVTTASTVGPSTVNPRLVGGGVLAAGAGVLGCVWLFRRRRERGG